MTFVSIKDVIHEKSWRGPTRGVFLGLRVEKLLNELLPQHFPEIADKVAFRFFRSNELHLFTISPTVSQEVYLNSANLLKKLNESLGGRAVKEIKLKIKPTPILAT